MDEQTIKLLLDTQAKAFQKSVEIFANLCEQKVKTLATTVEDLKESLLFTQKYVDSLKTQVVKISQKSKEDQGTLTRLESENVGLSEQVRELENRVNFMDDYNRRNNLIIEGVEEKAWETQEQTEVKVISLLTDKLDLPQIEVEQAHRFGKILQGKKRPIIVRYKSTRDRDATLRNAKKLKGTRIYINEDFCQATKKKREALLPSLKQAREEGKIAFLRHTRMITRERPVRNPDVPAPSSLTSSSTRPGYQETETSNHQAGTPASPVRRGINATTAAPNHQTDNATTAAPNHQTDNATTVAPNHQAANANQLVESDDSSAVQANLTLPAPLHDEEPRQLRSSSKSRLH